MGAPLDIGCTHGPQRQFPDENMADFLRRHLKGWEYPIVPCHVNCCGSDLWWNVRGNKPRYPAPPSPSPWRCYGLGRAIAETLAASPWLNWICLARAMEGRRIERLACSEPYLFNSDKAVVLFPAED